MISFVTMPRQSCFAGRLVLGCCLFLGVSVCCGAENAVARKSRLIVATREVPPFAFKDDSGQWAGISIALVREFAADLNAERDSKLRLEFRELPLDELIAAVEQGDVDLGAAAITVNLDREKRLDFSHPFHASGLGIAVSLDRGRVRPWRLLEHSLSETLVRVVLILFAVLLLSAAAIYLVERKGNPDHFGGGVLKGVGAGLWWAIVTITTVGYGDKSPKTLAGRAVAVLGIFAGIIVISMFTAAVTSIMTVSQLQGRISGPRDLPGVRVGTVKASTSSDYLASRHIAFDACETVDEALGKVVSRELDAVVYDAPLLRYEIFRKYYGKCRVLPHLFEEQNYAIAMPSGSPSREQVNHTILRMINRADWKDTLQKYLGSP
jgi:ABC-type amino acid transport substrate-binding protein